jgi:hypothetical protein
MLSASTPDRTEPDRDRSTDPRVPASITLLGAVIAAAMLFLPTRQPAANLPQTASVGPAKGVAPPVKIIGAAPRGEECADQVWPYIEPRCLTRAPNAKSASIATDQPAATHATTGTAPPERTSPVERAALTAVSGATNQPGAVPAAKGQPAHQRVATMYLSAPRAHAETTGLAAPPGAVPLRRYESDANASPQDDDGWSDRGAQPARSTEPRHRGQRWHRTRHDQRSFFGIPF